MLSYINVNLELLFCVAGECRSSVVSVSVQHIAAVCQGYSLGTNIPQFAAGSSSVIVDYRCDGEFLFGEFELSTG